MLTINIGLKNIKEEVSGASYFFFIFVLGERDSKNSFFIEKMPLTVISIFHILGLMKNNQNILNNMTKKLKIKIYTKLRNLKSSNIFNVI